MTSEEKSAEIKRLKEYVKKLQEQKEILNLNLARAKTALIDVRDWTDESEELWDDPGELAKEALYKIFNIK